MGTHTETSPKLKLSSDSPIAISEPSHDSNKLTTHKDTAGNPFIDDGPEAHDQTELQPHGGTDPFDQSDLSKDHFSGEETRYEEVTTMNLADILATPDEGNCGETEMRNVISSKEKEGEDAGSKSFISRIKSRFAKKSPHVKRSNTNEAQCDEGKIDDVNQSVEDTQFTTADMEASPGGEVGEKQSCIKRGVPKITKPAPPVVAVKMADLLGCPEGALNEQGITEKDENVETIPKKELDSSKAPTETMERERKDKLQKQQQQKLEKQKKEEEAKAKKEEERKAKQEQKEKEKAEKDAKLQEKKQRADEAKAKKEQERLNKQQEKEREKLEKEREKQVKAEEKQRLKDEKEKMKLLSKDQKDAGGKEPKDRLDEEADFEREQALELEKGQYNIREERDTDSRLSAIREETEEKDIIHSTDYRPAESDVQPSLTQ